MLKSVFVSHDNMDIATLRTRPNVFPLPFIFTLSFINFLQNPPRIVLKGCLNFGKHSTILMQEFDIGLKTSLNT
jgi:hypothetical protein